MKFGNLESIRSLAVVGATGLVGKEFLSILVENHIRIKDLRLIASSKSAGSSMEFGDSEEVVEELGNNSFEGVEVAFFSISTELSRKFIPHAVRSGCLVVDDSSAFRMEPTVPLVVPQINGALLRNFSENLIATPNCSTTPLVLCLKPLHDQYELKRVVVSTYQSVSGAGKDAFEELSSQTASFLNGQEKKAKVFPHRIAFNCLPQIGEAHANGHSEEEEKIVHETRKILDLPELKISATAVRVPTFCGHGLSVNVEFKNSFVVEELREVLRNFPGIKIIDKPKAFIYPTSVDCIGSDDTMVGRIRRDDSIPSGVSFWVITDNLRKGAALNALESLDTLYSYRRMI